MRISQRQLRQIIMQEMRKIKASNRHLMAEGSAGNPIRITPAYLNRLIKEEYELAMHQKRLAESRRRRLRAQRLAESKRRQLAAKRRRNNETIYYY